MGIVLSHQTALRALRTWDFIPHGRRSPLCPNLSCGRSAARDNATCFPIERPTAKQVSALRRVPSPFSPSEGGRPSLFDGPIHILVPEPRQRSQMRGVASHVWTSPLPPTLLREIQPGLLCAGPELCYAQLASVLDPVELVLLGNELLGTWTPYPPSPYGIVERRALTDVGRMRAALDQLGAHRGVARARRCLDLLAADSASPMESRLAAYFTLPRSMGGYALPAPQLNRSFDEDGRIRTPDRRAYRGDLCWPEASLVVEYDSDAAHTGSERIADDTRRRNALAERGITVVGVTWQQARSFEDLDRVARIVARILGHRMRERRPDQLERRMALHGRLFLQRQHVGIEQGLRDRAIRKEPEGAG